MASGIENGGTSAQMAIKTWSASLVRCPGQAFQNKWWGGNWHHAMEPWDMIGYRFTGK